MHTVIKLLRISWVELRLISATWYCRVEKKLQQHTCVFDYCTTLEFPLRAEPSHTGCQQSNISERIKIKALTGALAFRCQLETEHHDIQRLCVRGQICGTLSDSLCFTVLAGWLACLYCNVQNHGNTTHNSYILISHSPFIYNIWMLTHHKLAYWLL